MGRVFFILTTLSLMLALLTNRAPSAASALLNSAESGVSLMLTLLGTMTLWSGLMEVLLRRATWRNLGCLSENYSEDTATRFRTLTAGRRSA